MQRSTVNSKEAGEETKNDASYTAIDSLAQIARDLADVNAVPSCNAALLLNRG